MGPWQQNRTGSACRALRVSAGLAVGAPLGLGKATASWRRLLFSVRRGLVSSDRGRNVACNNGHKAPCESGPKYLIKAALICCRSCCCSPPSSAESNAQPPGAASLGAAGVCRHSGVSTDTALSPACTCGRAQPSMCPWSSRRPPVGAPRGSVPVPHSRLPPTFRVKPRRCKHTSETSLCNCSIPCLFCLAVFIKPRASAANLLSPCS